jgi:hypothetical protein
MGIIIYTKNSQNRRKQGIDLHKSRNKHRNAVRALVITNILSLGFIIYQNKETIINLMREIYGKLA